MSLQGVLNTNVTKASSIWVAAGFVQFTALATCIIMWLFNGRPEISGIFQVENKISLLGGVIGAFITFTVVKSVSDLGVAKAEVTIVVAQVIVAYIIELMGLFGSKKAGTLSPSRRSWINHVPLASFRGLGTFIL